jgi:ornithine--oxo-acid transaminase
MDCALPQKHAEVKPDILTEKQFQVVYPVSAVLANDTIMNVIQPGQHGSY